MLLLLAAQASLGCAYISDEHAAWRADPDADGSSWTEDCDESDPKTGAAQLWFSDADADGFGDTDTSKRSCSKPEGFVSLGGDCNDMDPRVRPGAVDDCDGIDDDCDGQIDEDADKLVFHTDADGDGFGDPADWMRACAAPSGTVEDNTDCDDTDPSRFPENPEVCDDLDNDCDEEVDEAVVDPPAWYLDLDGDGFGDPDNTSLTCDQPTGFVDNGDDCDDSTAGWQDLGPAEEFFNGIEDNCDPWDGDGDADGDGYWHEDYVALLTAEGLTPLPIPDNFGGDCDDEVAAINPGAIELPGSTIDVNCDGMLSADVDGDGYDAVSSGGTDCDDSDPLVHPGAIETCATEYDDDCDGLDNVPDTPGCVPLYVDEDGDGIGLTERAACLCRPDGDYTASISGDCDDEAADVFPDATEVCFDGVDSDCDGEDSHPGCRTDDMAEASLFGESGDDAAGTALGLTDDGQFLVGAPGYDFGGIENAGAVYVLPSDDPASLLLGGSGMRVTGSEDDANLGTAVLGLADGRVAVSAPGAGEGGTVYLIEPSGSSSEEVWDISTTHVDGLLGGDDFGAALVAGDLDPDGGELLVIGAPGPDYGAVWIIDPSISGEIYAMSAHGGITSTTWLDLGTVLAIADLDGSGTQDLVLGIPDGASEEEGAVAVVSGPLLREWEYMDEAADVILHGETPLDRFGSALSAPGDLDGDGRTDLVVGAEQAGVTEASEPDDPGAVYVLTEAGDGWPDSRTMDPYLTLWGAAAQDRTGERVLAQDVNGDGDIDLWISAGQNDAFASDAGAAYLVLGPLPTGTLELEDMAALVLTGDGAGAHFGRGLSSAGDIDGDGMDDLLIGAPDASGGSGSVLVLLGGDYPL
jgi:hypothetical protein